MDLQLGATMTIKMHKDVSSEGLHLHVAFN